MGKYLTIAAALALLGTVPAGAVSFRDEARAVRRSVGQPVYDLQDFHVGTIAGFAVSSGTPAAIVTLDKPRQKVAIALQNMTRRDRGGWMATLDTASVLQLRPWYPGTAWPSG